MKSLTHSKSNNALNRITSTLPRPNQTQDSDSDDFGDTDEQLISAPFLGSTQIQEKNHYQTQIEGVHNRSQTPNVLGNIDLEQFKKKYQAGKNGSSRASTSKTTKSQVRSKKSLIGDNTNKRQSDFKPTQQKPVSYLTFPKTARLDTFDNQDHAPKNPNDPEQNKDFKKAYLKLVKKVYQEQGQNMLISQSELEKASEKELFNQTEFISKVKQQIEVKEQKVKLMGESRKEAEMRECTFQPQTYSNKQKRNFEQFIDDQKMFQENRAKKQKEKSEQIKQEKENTYKKVPDVNKRSAQIVKEKKQKKIQEDETMKYCGKKVLGELPTYERLHNIHQEKMQKQAQVVMQGKSGQKQMKKIQSTANFDSKSKDTLSQNNLGSTISRGPLDNQLYDDARRRQEALQEKRKHFDKVKDDEINSTKPPPGHNSTSIKYALQKFSKEFMFISKAVLELQNQENEENTNQMNTDEDTSKSLLQRKINYVKLAQLLTELGFLPLNLTLDSIERELLFDLWNLLKGEQNQGITLYNLKKTLQVVLGLTQENDKFIDHQNKPESYDDYSAQFGYFTEQGEFLMYSQEKSRFFLKFKPLYINRVQHLGQYKRIKTFDQSCTFHPLISKTTEQLAIQRRIRMMSGSRQGSEVNNEDVDVRNVDIVEILTHPVNSDQQWKIDAKSILDQREMSECTFKPQINHAGYESSRQGGVKSERWEELYRKGRDGREKRDKTQVEFDYEKNLQECTFVPNISLSQNSQTYHFYDTADNHTNPLLQSNITTDTSTYQTMSIKGYQHVMTRMKKARDTREKAKVMLTRGIPGTQQDEAQMQPLQFKMDAKFKQSFNSISEKPTMTQSKSSENLTHPKKQRPHNKRSVSSIGKSDSPIKKQLEIIERSIEETVPQSFQADQSKDKQPLLYVDVNLHPTKSERIIVYDGDTAIQLADDFSKKHGLDQNMRVKLTQLLDSQMSGLLEKIDEDEEQVSYHSDLV